MQGKTKTSQFAHGADPWQFVDIHYPWNPRGDGYLTAASSSSGSAAAIAAYDWVDIAIGSDTRGSVRKPAALVGSYGIRPTWNSMNLSGVIPLATEMDTAGFFARDPKLFDQVSKLWYQDSTVPMNLSFTGSVPKKLVYPVDYFPLQNPDAQKLFEELMDTLEEEFDMKRVALNFTELLNEKVTNPSIRNITSFQLGSNRLAEYVSYQKVGKPLAEAWEDMFPGAGYPPLDPNPRGAFQRSVNLTEDDYNVAVERQQEFQEFFTSHVLRPDADTCSDGIMILDMGTGGIPSYRQQELNSLPGATTLTITTPGQGPTVPSNYLASMAHCPQIGFPVGQVAYQSYISMQEEMMPVNVDLVAAPGCDGLLLSIVEKLAAKGVVKTVQTGRTAF
jgi:Asp-tRNA(Asn)/Glu-tRNA(Gln) amidotransferase A subunit family amidase